MGRGHGVAGRAAARPPPGACPPPGGVVGPSGRPAPRHGAGEGAPRVGWRGPGGGGVGVVCFFLNDGAATEVYALPLHDALPILGLVPEGARTAVARCLGGRGEPGYRAGQVLPRLWERPATPWP